MFPLYQKLCCLPQFLITLQANTPDDEEFNLFLLTLLLLGMIFTGVCVAIGLFLAIVSLFIIFGFVTVGAISASVLIGIHKRSITTGFRTFALLFSTFAFALIGTASFWFLNRVFERFEESTAIIAGLCFGLISGIVFGIVAAYLIKKISSFLKNKLDNRKLSIGQ